MQKLGRPRLGKIAAAYTLLALLFLIASALLAVGCGGELSSSGVTEPTSPAAGGSSTAATSKATRPAPEFSGALLDGTQVSNATFLGEPAAIVFWGTW